LTICIAEDRESCEPALKLLIMSLNKHCGKLPINVFYPPARSAFRSWIGRYPQVTVHTVSPLGAQGWNVKPQALLYLMDQGFDQIIWIDCDIIITRDFMWLLSVLDPQVIAVAEEALWGSHDDLGALRARLWGFDVGRSLPFTLNTGVLRVTRLHYCLLRRWQEILESDKYRNVQQKVWSDRPVHMMGDQDVLTAILSSAEYAHVPLRILTRGNDIIQYFGLYGYTTYERALNIFYGLPPFIHSQGVKPWLQIWRTTRRKSLRDYIESIYLDLSPYTLAARSFQTELDCDCRWMTAHFKLSAVMRVGGMWYIPLVGLPIAFISDFVRLAKRVVISISRCGTGAGSV
jgi:hypothetical protein